MEKLSFESEKMRVLGDYTDTEKEAFPISVGRHDSGSIHKSVARGMPRTQRSQISNVLKAICICSLILAIPYLHWSRNHSADRTLSLSTQHRGGAIPPNETSDLCPQTAALLPAKHADLANKLDVIYGDENHKLAAYNALSGAVQIPCEIGRAHV